MVFSFFRKGGRDKPRKDDKARTTTGRATGSAAGRTTRGSAENTAEAERLRTRMRQAETAAKIDRIESEMTGTLATVLARGKKKPVVPVAALGPPEQPLQWDAAPSPPSPPLRGLAGAPAATATGPGSDEDDHWTAARATRHAGVDEIEISTLSAGSVIDEAAILFANGQADAAEAALRSALKAGNLGAQLPLAYQLLLELVAQRGDRSAFDVCAAEFVAHCAVLAPGWIAYGSAREKVDLPAVALPAVVDAGIVKALEQLKSLTALHPALVLDVSATERIDAVGAQLLLRVIQAFKRSALALAIAGVERLESALRAAIEPGRRDASDAPWMLLLEVLRLRGQAQDFDELGLQYCVTFEVSPPTWEPAPRNLTLRAAGVAPGTAPAADAGALAWSGEIDADADRVFAQFMERAGQARGLTVDCRQLRRIGFGAASSLLAHLLNLRDQHISIAFERVNPLVAALFDLLGVTSLASVAPRLDND